MKIRQLQIKLQSGKKILVDSGMGTEIFRRHVQTTLPLWSAEALFTHPEVIQSIHEDTIRAGAEIIITNTFRTTKRAFAKKGIAEKAKNATIIACKLAQNAIANVQPAQNVFIAGSMAPLEDCYSPELTPANDMLQKEHNEYANNLKIGGVDFFLIETMITLRETLACIKAAKLAGLPFAVSFCTNEKGLLLGGESLEHIIPEIERYHPLFIGVNCVSPEIATKTLKILTKITNKPLSVYAQGDGIPNDDQGWEFIEEKNITNYLTHATQWLYEGAQIIGGCCGTSPLYIQKLQLLLSAYESNKKSII